VAKKRGNFGGKGRPGKFFPIKGNPGGFGSIIFIPPRKKPGFWDILGKEFSRFFNFKNLAQFFIPQLGKGIPHLGFSHFKKFSAPGRGI